MQLQPEKTHGFTKEMKRKCYEQMTMPKTIRYYQTRWRSRRRRDDEEAEAAEPATASTQPAGLPHCRSPLRLHRCVACPMSGAALSLARQHHSRPGMLPTRRWGPPKIKGPVQPPHSRMAVDALQARFSLISRIFSPPLLLCNNNKLETIAMIS